MLLSLAVAPVFIVLFYTYIRDKYEKEPIRLLVVGVTFGAIITFPIVLVGNVALIFLPLNVTIRQDAMFNAFIVAAFVEEIFKYIVLFFLTWENRNLNEKFDGIVYGVFISLGFAFVENILFVFSEDMGGVTTALSRAIISVPGHGLFGIYMGYYFTIAKFGTLDYKNYKHGKVSKKHKSLYLTVAFLLPWLLHGAFNFFILSGSHVLLFLLFVILLWQGGFIKMHNHIKNSPFKANSKR